MSRMEKDIVEVATATPDQHIRAAARLLVTAGHGVMSTAGVQNDLLRALVHAQLATAKTGGAHA